MEDLTMLNQISAFRSAEIIVAPHGAGLANLCFCRPGTKILEITTPYRVLSLFTRLANAAELEFHLHLAKPVGKRWLHGDTAVGDSNILVDIGDFERTLVRLLD
jgi:capsular polysaccharide biosynthesis protein